MDMQWPEAGLEKDFLGRQIPQQTVMLEEEGESKLFVRCFVLSHRFQIHLS
jgi:hypothetical protein